MSPEHGRRTLSIRGRLALWYAASVLLVFLVFAATLRATVRTALRNEFTTGVRSSADAIQSFFRLEHEEYRDVIATITHISDEVVFPDRIVEFIRPDGAIAFRVGPARKARTRDARPVPAASTLIAPVRSMAIPLDTRIAPGWRLQVFASAAPLERSLAMIDGWLIVGMPLGFLVAWGMGWWLAGRTLRPVGAMAEAAMQMASARDRGVRRSDEASRRLPIENPSDELGRLGTRFNALLDQVDGVLAQQRRFLADAAHELRTPVARMMGNVDLALLDPGDTISQNDALVRVRGDLDRTARLVDELLQLARADAAGVVRPQPGYLDDVVVDAVHAWQPAAARRGVTLSLQTLEEAPASIDPVYLERMMGILLDNAIRYSQPGESVEVCVSTTGGGVARLAVSDRGIGLATDEGHRIFERFYRGAGARAMSPDGSGLGLPIARWIAEAHGAAIALEPRDGGGTVATVTFPAVPVPPAHESGDSAV